MSKTVVITKENVARTRGHLGKAITRVDIQFTLTGQGRDVSDDFIRQLDEFVGSFNDALDPTKELRAAARMIAQINCSDEFVGPDELIRPEVSK